MSKGGLFWRIVPPNLLLVAGCLAIVIAYVIYRAEVHQQEDSLVYLQQKAFLLSPSIVNSFEEEGATGVDDLLKSTIQETLLKAELLDVEGIVIAHSHSILQPSGRSELNPAQIDLLESNMAIRGVQDQYLQKKYFAIIPIGSPLIGFLRLTTPKPDGLWFNSSTLAGLLALSIFILGLFGLISANIVQSLAEPLAEMETFADHIAGGNLSYRIPEGSSKEFSKLSTSLNHMASQLEQTLTSLQEQRNEQQAIFASMSEGVLAVDCEDRIFLINSSVQRFLGLNPQTINHARLWERVRNQDLLKFVDKLKETGVHSVDISLYERGIDLHVQGTTLKNNQKKTIGYLLVIRDVTRIKQLESMRSEFVANVSHELKTPVTAIKGFVETVMQDTLDDPVASERFLAIALRHTDRLTAIINDLLDLSRLEQDNGPTELRANIVPLIHTIERAVDVCQLPAEKEGVILNYICDDRLELYHNADLIEQALVNLIINAIKFSSKNHCVDIQVTEKPNHVEIFVQDYGVGIAKEHLSRIFERFYRVDKARSRMAGGTGLGLAIVKHIAQAHQGKIEVRSKPGEGSCFTLTLPKDPSIIPEETV